MVSTVVRIHTVGVSVWKQPGLPRTGHWWSSLKAAATELQVRAQKHETPGSAIEEITEPGVMCV
jgi:hypothetical protein